MSTPSPATRGRMVAAAVAVGAMAAATQAQGVDQTTTATASTLLAAGTDLSAHSGVGGNQQVTDTLPLPEVLPVVPSTQSEDVTSLAKGQRIADERAAAEESAAAAERAADERAEAQRAAAQRAEQLPVAAGSVVMPAMGRITSGFGARWGTIHYGLDIANRIGTPIYATTDGVVVESGPASGFGLWVRVRHADGTISAYGHINESLVTEGQRVAAGQQIATMGNRGQSTGPHLHFEIWLPGGQKVNPLTWLRQNGVLI